MGSRQVSSQSHLTKDNNILWLSQVDYVMAIKFCTGSENSLGTCALMRQTLRAKYLKQASFK